jgi:hypothetical protein
MSTLYIAEVIALGLDAHGQTVLAPMMPPVAEQTVVIGSGSVASAAFGGTTRFVRIHTDAICSIAFGSAPTATSTNARMNANTTEYFGVSPGLKVAVITNS